jgi:hypothetical protein
MQLAGTTSWKMGTDEPQSLLTALYLRDAAGLRPQVDPDLPPLEPAVPFDHELPRMPSVASDQWADWWRQLLDGGGFWPDQTSPVDITVTGRSSYSVCAGEFLIDWYSRVGSRPLITPRRRRWARFIHTRSVPPPALGVFTAAEQRLRVRLACPTDPIHDPVLRHGQPPEPLRQAGN